MGLRGAKVAVSGYGFNERLQLVGGNAYGQPYSLGLAIPPTPATNPANRYYFNLTPVIRLGAHEKIRITGLWQYLEIGADVAEDIEDDDECTYPLVLPVTSDTWAFTDANVSWHLTLVNRGRIRSANTQNTDGFIFGYSETPALLYQSSPADAGGYLGPNGGRPYGQPIVPDLANFSDMRFVKNVGGNWHNLDIEVQGPGDVMFSASVRQTVPESRCNLVLPVGFPANANTMRPEDAFVFNVSGLPNLVDPGVVYRRIAGGIIYERDNFFERPNELIELRPKIDRCGRPDPRTRRGS